MVVHLETEHNDNHKLRCAKLAVAVKIKLKNTDKYR
jgi:hypothetical protein